MSDTTFVHEVTRELPLRVALTMDLEELLAMADVARLAVDAAVLLPDVEDVTASNADVIYTWALRTAGALESIVTSAKE
jgi:hypothetical protein